MLKRIWKSLVGCVKWFFWVLGVAICANAIFLCALIITPALFYFFFRARSSAEVFDAMLDRTATRLAEELNKFEWKDVEFEMDFGDGDEDELR